MTRFVTITGGFISFFYVVQKQKLEELQTFKELFNEFNRRYDKLNEKLNRIVTGKVDTPLTEDGGFCMTPRQGIFQGLYNWHELRRERDMVSMDDHMYLTFQVFALYRYERFN